MRAYNTNLGQYIDWVVNDRPDSLGTYSGYNPLDLSNITVNKVVQSKIDNYLKPLISSDGYFFHLNSYDWLHSTPPGPPIPVPSRYVGLAVVRGSTDGVTPRNFATIVWDETEQRFKFVFNTNGDHLTLGNYIPINTGNLTVDGYIAVGTLPALSGVIRIPNNQWIEARRASGSTDGYLIRLDNIDRVQLGTLADNPIVYVPGNIRVDGYIRDGSATPSTSGFIRNGNGTVIITARDTASTDLNLLATNASNQMLLGNASATFGNILYNTSTNALHQFQTNTSTFLELGITGTPSSNNPNNFVRFPATIVAPSVYQTTTGTGSGQVFNVQAQSTTAAAQTGGSISLTAGSGPTGGFGGTVDLLTGSTGSFPVAGTLKMRIHPTVAPTAANNNSIEFFENLLRIATAQSNPRIRQDDVTTTSTNGQSFTFQAQNATGTTSTGGNAVITSGTGTTSAGNVVLQTGGVDRVLITPSQMTVFGNLLVGGTTTSIASTVIELADRVIHVNSSANIPIGTNVPVPTQLTGFSVDRGQTGGSKRDYYGVFWHETDQYWKFAINTDGYTTENTLSNNLATMASYYLAQPTAALTVAAVPTIGGFRALNNTTAVASRNQASTQDLPLLGTDTSNRIVHGSGTNNGGHIFNTTAATIYDFQVGSASAYTISPISAGTTTLSAASTVTALLYSHATTGSATGANTTIQAQNAATTGGNAVITSGTGGTTAGDVVVQTGGVSKIIVHPTFSEFRDTAEAIRVTPVSAGTTAITYAGTVTAANINQTTTGGATGAPMTIQAQNAATTGGLLALTSGTGTTAGNVDIQIGGVSKLLTTPTQFTLNNSTVQWASSITSPVINQAANVTLNGTAQNLTISAQNATGGGTSTGGSLILNAGTGATNGNIRMAVGSSTAIGFTVNPTGTTTTNYVAGVTAINYVQSNNTSTGGATMQFTAQTTTADGYTGGILGLSAGNATGTTGTGGSVNISSGTGNTNPGSINFRVGTTTFATFLTPNPTGAVDLNFVNTITAPRLIHANNGTASYTGAPFTIQAQNATGATSIGGDLILRSGTGTTVDGYTRLFAGNNEQARVVPNKFFMMNGQRIRTDIITTTPFTILDGYYVSLVDTGTTKTVNLPANPILGDTYQVKDFTGQANSNNITVSGNGRNIDGSANYTISANYGSVVVVFNGSTWSVL